MLRETITENGRVRGLTGTDARITVYKGIPYAAPPVGENRWRAPQPCENWEGVRECFEFGPINMQRTPGKNPDAFYSKEWHVDPEVPMSEDSLYLNIWTPAKSTDENLPVMVWIFGGGFQEGYSWEMEFDGERIASRGVILVSIGYRLNVFGFLSHPELTAQDPENPTNFGLLDQLAAIQWVGRNIRNFGGDPKNITIFGQSAGGDGVYAHLCSPRSKGAFQKGIVESNGGFRYPYPKNFLSVPRETLNEAEAKGVRFLEWLGVSSIEEARTLDAQYLEEKQAEFNLFAIPVVDGKFLLRDMPQTVLHGEMNDIPFMIGNTADEFPVGPAGESEAEIAAWAKENFGDRADEFMEIVRREAAAEGKSLKAAASISSFEIGAQLALHYMVKYGRDPYYYRFDPTVPGADDPGAYHSCDLWFEFETLMKCWRPFDGHHFDLSRKMCNYWTNFAKTGDPNGLDADGTPMPKWEKYTKENKTYLKFFDEVSVSDEVSEKLRFLLDLNLRFFEEGNAI